MTYDHAVSPVAPPPQHRAFPGGRWLTLVALVAVVLSTAALRPAPSSAADAVFANGYVTDIFGPWVNITKIGVRSLDGHSSCWNAYDGASYTSDFCTNDLSNSTYGAVYRTPHCFTGWTGNAVQMRCRVYW